MIGHVAGFGIGKSLAIGGMSFDASVAAGEAACQLDDRDEQGLAHLGFP